ncbi:MBL fold metallo-hydrolase [Shewanella woodyi]|uniref:MBL fold metallo-hydrolase n=1 Tax=Shewanella woodyi TaxID=60961 RepID=UPI0007EBDA04|nr:MBL fold metallo-hydrolase [Shewanella woodyi]
MICKTISTTLILLALLVTSSMSLQASEVISLDIFKGETASVNSYVFSNGQSLIVMDVQRSTSEAKKLAKFIKDKEKPLSHILITHGHPDHYIGMDWLLKEFPETKVVVANIEIKKDIIGFSTWMESVGWLDSEPTLKPKSDKNPNGFDYENKIDVLAGGSLKFNEGGALKLETYYKPAEANHVTTVFVDSLNSFFMSDLGYNKVHLWMGQGVTEQHITNWRDQLELFDVKYSDRDLIIYPGHGAPTKVSLFTTMIEYINNFQRVVASASSKEVAMSEMKRLYPDYKEADFLLKYSVDFHSKK